MKILFILLQLWLACVSSLMAQKSEVFNSEGKAIRGYDAVSYFTESKARQGSAQFVHSWKGSEWFFVSKQNLQAFIENPEKYAPQYGGYCAYGMGEGHKATTQPDAWTIVNGKLYLNYNKEVQKLWNANQSKYVQMADKNWPALKNKE